VYLEGIVITVFDIATKKELMGMFSVEGEEYDREELLKDMESSPDYNNAKLALLYGGRGNYKKADEYLDLIKDEEYRRDFMLLIHESVD
jgi:hypothetical protein